MPHQVGHEEDGALEDATSSSPGRRNRTDLGAELAIRSRSASSSISTSATPCSTSVLNVLSFTPSRRRSPARDDLVSRTTRGQASRCERGTCPPDILKLLRPAGRIRTPAADAEARDRRADSPGAPAVSSQVDRAAFGPDTVVLSHGPHRRRGRPAPSRRHSPSHRAGSSGPRRARAGSSPRARRAAEQRMILSRISPRFVSGLVESLRNGSPTAAVRLRLVAPDAERRTTPVLLRLDPPASARPGR